MSCDRLLGVNPWPQARLVFSDSAEAVLDDHLLDVTSVAGGVVNGRFRGLGMGNPPLGDTMTNGTCAVVGPRARVRFTRNHAGGNVTTVYTGQVIVLPVGAGMVMIRGTFTRATRNMDGTTTLASGDWETEKPT